MCCCAMEMTRQLDTRAPTSLSRGHISVRPETQVMAQHNNTVHHKPPVPAPTQYQYIVLDDLVRKAVRKEWLELDYGAQWWSNDHAPTIYAHSKLIPSLNSFLSNRWSELKLILQKRPVATKKIRLKKNSETTSNQEKDCAPTSTPAVQQQANDAKHNHQPAAIQQPSASLPHSSLRHIPPDTTLSMVHSPPDIKPVHLSRLDYQNVKQNNSFSVNQSVNNMFSMPISNGTYDAFTSNNCMANIADKNALTPPSSGPLKPKPSYSYLRNLIEGTYEPSQQNFNKNNLQNPFILTTGQDNSLKMKIKLNSSGQVARSKQHKKKVDEINLKKQAEEAGNVVPPKKLKQNPSENPKKRKRRVRIKYTTPHKIKKCYVKLVPLSDEILRKYTGIGIDDLKILSKNNMDKKRRPGRKKKTPVNRTTIKNCNGTNISCSQPPSNVISSISSVQTSSDSSQCSSLPSLPIINLGSTPAFPVSSAQIIDSLPLPAHGTTVNDLTIKPLNTTKTTMDENETKSNHEQGKTAHLSEVEKLEILKSENLSVASVKRSLSCDSVISINRESQKPTEVPKLNMATTNQEFSECESSKNSFEKCNEVVETGRSELAFYLESNEDNIARSELATQLEGNQDNVGRSDLATQLEGNHDNIGRSELATQLEGIHDNTSSSELPTHLKSNEDNIASSELATQLEGNQDNVARSELATELEGNLDNVARCELALQVEGNHDNIANLSSEQLITSDSNISPNIKLGNKEMNGILKRRERTLSSSPLRFGKLNSDYVNGKIIPLGQKSSPTTIKRRSSEGSFDMPTISSCISLATLAAFNNNQETPNKEQEKLSPPLINSNKDANGVDTSVDLNMNYKNNKLLEKPLTNNISLNKNTHKEANTIFKDADTGDSTDSNKENTFIAESINNTDETTKKHRLDDNQPQQQSPKRLRIDARNDDSKCNLKIDLNRMKLEEETNDDAVIQTLIEQHPKNETEDSSKSVEQIERPIMDLAAANFVNYNCIRCNGVFMHFKEWKMHYDDGHPKCANVTAQSS